MTARTVLTDVERSEWGTRAPTIAPTWHRHREYISPALQYPVAVRRLLSTTNAIESLHMQLRKIIKTRGHFPTDDAATKLLYLALRNIMAKSQRASREWNVALPIWDPVWVTDYPCGRVTHAHSLTHRNSARSWQRDGTVDPDTRSLRSLLRDDRSGECSAHPAGRQVW
ncbi:MAG: transposase, Mutator family protein [Gemmatimonadetes bacterium]|nr:transposase, Mutator family protein [Gemmatimonadota bacterium]